MIKRLLLIFVVLMIATISLLPTSAKVSAENAKATEIREIFSSKTYYIEYELNRKEDKRALAVDGDKIKSFDCENRRNVSAIGYIPIVGMFAKGSFKLTPEVFYDSKNYYQFIDKKKILMATESEINDPYINPKEDWSSLALRIRLPEEFGMFTGDDAITFVESNTRIIDTKKNIQVEFDKYVKVIKSVTGKNIAKKVYFVFYSEKGELDKIYSLTVNWDEDAGIIFNENIDKKPEQQDYTIQKITIKKLTKELPKNVMAFPKGAKVYGPGLGNMNELLEQPPLIESY
ncbi:MAG: hypothetical protein IJ797_08690 [Selenomonadaceae bacterium]|nr:hypothetical protein [Selenomonadaceae bacterium]